MLRIARYITLVLALVLTGCNSGYVANQVQASPTSSGPASNQTYYIDASGGNDKNDGLTSGTAWQTIAKVRSTSFTPGDQLLFKRGETWILSTDEDIQGQNGMTYASYGSGALPIIDGNHVADVFHGKDVNNITLRDLNLRNGRVSDAQFYRSSHINIENCEMSGAGNDNLVFIDNNTNISVTGGKYHDPVRAVSSALVTNIEIADGGSDFVIDGAELYGAENAGLSIHNHTGTNVPTNVTVRNVNSHDNAGYGLDVINQDQTPPVSISILNSVFDRNDTGLRIQKSSQVSNSYLTGNILIDQSRWSDNRKYSLYVEADDVTIQRSLFTGSDQQILVVDGRNIKFINNTVYAVPTYAMWLFYIDGSGRAGGIRVNNNIFYMANDKGEMVGTGPNSTTDVVFDYNEFYFPDYRVNARWYWNGTGNTYENWVAQIGQDAHSLGPTSDPLFTNIEAGDFTLQPGSPAIDRGTDSGLPFGGAAPDLGAYP